MGVSCKYDSASLKKKNIKLWPKILKYVFIGYAYNSRAHWFLIHKSSIEDKYWGHASSYYNKLRNAIFFKDVFSLNKV